MSFDACLPANLRLIHLVFQQVMYAIRGLLEGLQSQTPHLERNGLQFNVGWLVIGHREHVSLPRRTYLHRG